VQSNQVYIWDGTRIAQKRASDGSTVQRKYFAQGFEEGTSDYYLTKDHLGSIREVVASDGTTIEAVYDYSPWGEVTKIGASGVESDFLYTGHFYHVESDLHLTLYRAYNPELGMWLSRDPIAENGGINLYAYVGNDPINYVDPQGLCPALAIPFIFGGGGISAGTAVTAGAAVTAGGVTVAAANDGVFERAGTNLGNAIGDWLYPGATYLPPMSVDSRQTGSQRDTGLANVSDADIQDRARDKSLSREERRRYQKEEKARGLRNRNKDRGCKQ